MEYKDERSDDLRLRVFRGALELDAFPVLERRRRVIGDFAVDASIIGASHAVQFTIGGETTTEVLACSVAAADLYADRLEGVWRIHQTVSLRSERGLGYLFACDVRPLEQAQELLAEFREFVQSADGAGGIGLTFRFPQRTAEPPETLLHVAVQNGEMRIRSLHVYPGEAAVVVSETSLVPALGMEAAPQLMEVGSR